MSGRGQMSATFAEQIIRFQRPAKYPIQQVLFLTKIEMIMKKKVLFICIHNSARSQMAEAFLKQICGDFFEVYSAGLEPGKLNPLVVEAMQEIGIDISA